MPWPLTKARGLSLPWGGGAQVLSVKEVGGKKAGKLEALVGDASGCVLLAGKKDGEGELLKKGATLEVNASVEMFRGAMRLAPKSLAASSVSLKPNSANNMSEILFDFVEAK